MNGIIEIENTFLKLNFVNSESTDDLTGTLSRTTSQCNSPATQASVSRGSTPSRSSTDLTSAASSVSFYHIS